MAFINPFDLTGPQGSDPANNIDGYILDGTKKSLDERIELEHQSLATGTNDPTSATAQGRHIPGKVGCLYLGLDADIKNPAVLSGMGSGAIAYATDTKNFYRYEIGVGWTIIALSAETILVDETLRIIPGGSGNVLEMNHDYQQWTSTTTLVDGANIATDCDDGNSFEVVLGGNRILDNPTNLQEGATYVWLVKQDVTGTRTLSFGSSFLWSGGLAPTLTPTTGAVDIITAICKNEGTELIPDYKLYCSVLYDFS
jgi:hypothetical protein